MNDRRLQRPASRTPGAAEPASPFRESLRNIVECCEGAAASAVIGSDGIAVETVSREPSLDLQTVSSEFSAVLAQIRSAAEILEVGGLEEVAIQSERLTFVVRVLNDEFFLGLAIWPQGNVGKGRYLMRMALPDLRARL